MGRLACIDLVQLPLQLICRRNPDWAGLPVAVVRDDKPGSPLLFINQKAEEEGARAGQRYSEVLSIIPGLRAGVVSADEVRAALAEVAVLLASFSPDVEPCAFDENIFWVNVAGLQGLYTSPARWLVALREALQKRGFSAHIVVGFTRFGTWALSRPGGKSGVLRSPKEEEAAMGQCSITAFPVSFKTRRMLERLGIRTAKDFLGLPQTETIARFGKEAKFILDLLRQRQDIPLQAHRPVEALSFSRRFDSPIVTYGFLRVHLEALVRQVVEGMEGRGCSISEIVCTFVDEEGEKLVEVIRPSKPTTSESMLMRLLDLRLSGRAFKSGIELAVLDPAGDRVSRAQSELFAASGRDVDSGARAFALIRARFGNDAVSSARLLDSCVPERSFSWEAAAKPSVPKRGVSQPRRDAGQAVRRIFLVPVPLRTKVGGRPLAGPFIVANAWWESGEGEVAVHRDYYFQQVRNQHVLWMYLDRATSALYTQGVLD